MDNKVREIQLLKEAREGDEAKAFVFNPLWIETIAEMESMYLRSIKSNKWLDMLDRKNIIEAGRRIQVLDDIKCFIENKITTGEEAHKRLEANRNGSKQRRA
jgi:hypothetical protein